MTPTVAAAASRQLVPMVRAPRTFMDVLLITAGLNVAGPSRPGPAPARSGTGQAGLQPRRLRGGLARGPRGLRGPQDFATCLLQAMAATPGQGPAPRPGPRRHQQATRPCQG